MINSHMILGYLGDEPKVFETPDGNVNVTFRVATTENSFQTARGQVVPERTTWHNVSCWGGLARACKVALHKGSRVFVQGIHHTREFPDKDGRQQIWHEIDAQNIEFLTPKPESK